MEQTFLEFPDLGINQFRLNRFVTDNLFGLGISIAWYGVIISIAMILACTLIARNAVKKEGFDLDSFLDYFIITIPLGVVGARAMYVLTNLDHYETFGEMIAVWHGGLAIYGGILVGMLCIFVISRVKKQSFLAVCDAVVPGLLLAQAIGRWGNFVNGEAYGEATRLPWGMMVNGTGPWHPTFLYESLITFSGFLIAQFLIYRFRKTKGTVFAFYLLWYGVGRYLVEGLRTDSLYIGSTGIRASQLIGILCAIAGALMFAFFFVRKKFLPAAETAGAENDKKAEEPAATESEETEPEETDRQDKTEPDSEKESEEK